jgi:branched-subunit amino acid permease
MDEQKTILQRLGSRFTAILLAIAAVLVVLEFIFHRHGEVAAEDFPLFPALFGFLAFLFIVQVGKWLRVMIMRDEDYYDD